MNAHIRDTIRTNNLREALCGTCDGHRGEIDHYGNTVRCGDCEGTGLDLSAPWGDPMPGVTAFNHRLAFGKAAR